jgi:cyanophycin synthetase
LLVGDIGFGECYAPRSGMARLWPRLAIDGHRFSLARLMDLLRHADLVVGNLEVPLAETPNPALRHTKKYLHWSDPNETVAALVAGGFGALSLANNHSLDCGPAGLAETTRLLRAAGLVPFGAGPDLATAALPYVRTVAVGPVKKTIVVFGGFELRPDYEKLFDWYARTDRAGANPIDPDAVSSQITQLRDTLPDPLFVAYPHWGVDYRDTMPAQRDLAAALITAGVDLVIGHGAHLLQGIETIRGRKVIYGLGNFVFNSPGRFAKHVAPPYGLVAALRLYHGEAGVSAALRLYPLFVDNAISDFQSRPVSAGEFPDARAVLTKHYDGLAGDLAFGVDRVGHYLETPIQM